MPLTIAAKQNLIYFTFVVIVAGITCLLYFYTQDEWILFRQAEIHYENKDFKAAALFYNKSIQAGLPRDRAILNLAGSYVVIGQFDEAISLYKEYLIYNPKDVKVRLELARVLSWIGKFDEAEIEYQQVLELENANKKTK